MRTLKGITYLASHIFDGGVAHGFLSRKGGVSAQPYDSLNLGERETDKREHIEENRKRVLSAFGASSLCTITQVHGSAVFCLGPESPPAPPEADAIITAEDGAAVGILTADCLPILLFDPVHRAVGAVHAGWRGTALGVTLNAVREMGKNFGTSPRDLKAALGPSIGPCCYSVGENVHEEFRERGRSLDSFISLDDGLRLDLGAENISQLLSLGVDQRNISGSAPCTSCSGDFFSYRRDCGRTGRQLSFIMLRSGGAGAGL